jgi:hypothetical protein
MANDWEVASEKPVAASSSQWEVASEKPAPPQPITDKTSMRAAPSGFGRVTAVTDAVGKAGINSTFPYIHPFDAVGAGVQAVENQVPSDIQGGVGKSAKQLAPIMANEAALLSGGDAFAEGMTKATTKVPGLWNRLTGYTADLEKAKAANLSKYLEVEQRAGESISEAKKGVEAAKAARPKGQAGTWADLNESIGTPSKSLRLTRGSADVSQGYGIPGRGLEREGFNAATLSKMTPVEQSAVISPKWNAAGKAVENSVKQATEKGATLDVGKSAFEVLKKIDNPQLQDKAIELFNQTARDLGIGNTREATPEQAWKLRKALKSSASFGPTGDLSSIRGTGAQLYRAVSSDLHNAVPGLKEIDMHYGDLTEAISAIQKNVGKYMTGKWKPPVSAVEKATSKIPDRPNVSPYTPLPSKSAYNTRAAKVLGGSALGGAAAYGVHQILPSH